MCLLTVLGGSVVAVLAVRQRIMAEKRLAEEARLVHHDVDLLAARRRVYSIERVPAGTTFSNYLQGYGVEAVMTAKIVQAAQAVYDLRRLRAGNQITFVHSGKGELRAIVYEIDVDRVLWITADDDVTRAEIRPVPYQLRVEGVAGQIENSLFEALTAQGEQPLLAIELADIFGWDIDFYTDPRKGDTFELFVEKKVLNGELLGYGRVLAAQYRNGDRLHQAIRFRDPEGQPAYYAPSGKSMKKAFLRSPLKFGAVVTSRFSYSRFHPILRRPRPHLGIDYGAPVGSPVQAVADGRVMMAGWKGEAGKMVHLRHAMGYETFYLHLSRINVRAGQQVRQGEIIGLSGSTGLSTGPHLDFRIRQHGQFRNFLQLKLPPARAVAKEDWEEFVAVRSQFLDQLAGLHQERFGSSEQVYFSETDQSFRKGN